MKTEQLQRIEDSYSERNARYWKQNLAVCVFGSLTTAVSLTMLLPFLPIFVEELGIKQQASIVQWSALAFGATFLGTGLTAPLWGHLGDKYGRKSMLVRAAIVWRSSCPLSVSYKMSINSYSCDLLQGSLGDMPLRPCF